MVEPSLKTELSLIRLFGPPEDTILHAPVPLQLGRDAGGRADVLVFNGYIEGCTLLVTTDLVECNDQMPSATYQRYEIAMATRKVDCEWGAEFVSNLAAYTLSTPIGPGETMSVESALPDRSTLSSVLFFDYGVIESENAIQLGVIGVMGITPQELAFKSKHGGAALEESLKSAGVFPLTDHTRASTIP